MAETGPEILTVGHSTHPPERFLHLLRRHGVEALADVRRYPGSRRHPHFGAERLASALAEAGISYVQLGEELGGRRRASPRSANPGWRVPGFRAYADHMASPEFASGIERLAALAGEHRTAVMCAEGSWRRCHRQLISDALLVRGWRVLHVLPDGGVEEHRLTPFARARGDEITYPGEQNSLGV